VVAGFVQALCGCDTLPAACARLEPITTTRGVAFMRSAGRELHLLQPGLRQVLSQTAVLLAACLVSSGAVAQFGAGARGPSIVVVPPEREFATSDAHYQSLREQANGGTKHTMETIPRWEGLWNTAGNNHMELFIDAGLQGGTVREGVLTPAYEVAYKE